MEGVEEYRFGPFRLLPARQELLRDGAAVTLGGRSFDLLLTLLEGRGGVVGKRALFDAVWPNLAVEGNNLSVTVSALRKALGCGNGEERYIATIPGRGYRFVAPVEAILGAPPATPAAVQSAEPPGNLPRAVASLIGREPDIARIAQLLDQHRLVTITGAGGIGKTRISLAVAEATRGRYPDGVWLVELAPLAAAELVAETIAKVLGLTIAGSRSAAEAVATYLRQKQLLLILDNCEHLIGETARVAELILTQAPAVEILASSRESLRVPGEQAYRLPSLSFPDTSEGITAANAMGHSAVRLFVARARAALDDFEWTDAVAPVVAQICQHLDGIALAIELAAARLRMLGAEELLARLDDRFATLTGGSRTAPPRHQTLRALIDWSYDLLPESEQVLLRRLAVFAGSFTIDAAVEVAAGGPIAPDEVFDLVASLVDKSLVVALPARAGSRRFTQMESIRRYGLARLHESGEADLPRRLAEYLTRLYTTADERWETTSTEAWLAAYAPDLENLRAGLGWAFGPDGDAALGVRLVSLVDELFLDLSIMPERRRWLDLAAARLSPSTGPLVEGRIRLAQAYTGAFGQRRNLPYAREAVALLRQAGQPLWLAMALRMIGTILARPGDAAEAEAYLREGELLLRPLGPTKALTALLDTLGSIRFLADDRTGGRAYAEESLGFARALGLRRGIEATTMNLAEYDFAAGDVQGAITQVRAAEAACRATGSLLTLSYVLTNLTCYLLAAGETAAARRAGCEALRLNCALGDEFLVTNCIEHLALAIARDGDLARAARLAGHGEAYYRARGVIRQFSEQQTWNGLTALLEARLQPAELARRTAEGAAWTADQATEAALAE